MNENFKHPTYQKKIKFKKNIIGNKKENKKKWVIFITTLSFLMSVFFLLVSELLLENATSFVSFIIVLIIILIGIIFDIIGIAVTAADEAPFHALASRKYFGAKRSIRLIRNANKVSSFCNDVVGDICGIISGTAGALIVIRITAEKLYSNQLYMGCSNRVELCSYHSEVKAIGKLSAISNSNYIVYNVGCVLQISSKLI